jgi:membrane peptidoglycan carboxypeptidase
LFIRDRGVALDRRLSPRGFDLEAHTLAALANAYRTIASGILAQPYVIQKIVGDSGQGTVGNEHGGSPVSIDDSALSLIQEGLRGVVRLPTGTAHALDPSTFPIAVMGKTGTTNDFTDALFVGYLRP